MTIETWMVLTGWLCVVTVAATPVVIAAAAWDLYRDGARATSVAVGVMALSVACFSGTFVLSAVFGVTVLGLAVLGVALAVVSLAADAAVTLAQDVWRARRGPGSEWRASL